MDICDILNDFLTSDETVRRVFDNARFAERGDSMYLHHWDRNELDPQIADFYRRALAALNQLNIPVLVGGGYALEVYTGVQRKTKDLDLFVRPEDLHPVLDCLSSIGFRTEVTSPLWLGKVFQNDHFIDVIFNSGNGICPVDDVWFAHAAEADLLGVSVQLCPPEETIWQKAFIMERDRYDGADIAHLLKARAEGLDWDRLIQRFGSHWRVLLSHLVLFGYIYPAEQSLIPSPILQELLDRVREEAAGPACMDLTCRGTLLSNIQYRSDVDRHGYIDARLWPDGLMPHPCDDH
jgi:hypothetical protein